MTWPKAQPFHNAGSRQVIAVDRFGAFKDSGRIQDSNRNRFCTGYISIGGRGLAVRIGAQVGGHLLLSFCVHCLGNAEVFAADAPLATAGWLMAGF